MKSKKHKRTHHKRLTMPSWVVEELDKISDKLDVNLAVLIQEYAKNMNDNEFQPKKTKKRVSAFFNSNEVERFESITENRDIDETSLVYQIIEKILYDDIEDIKKRCKF